MSTPVDCEAASQCQTRLHDREMRNAEICTLKNCMIDNLRKCSSPRELCCGMHMLDDQDSWLRLNMEFSAMRKCVEMKASLALGQLQCFATSEKFDLLPFQIL